MKLAARPTGHIPQRLVSGKGTDNAGCRAMQREIEREGGKARWAKMRDRAQGMKAASRAREMLGKERVM